MKKEKNRNEGKNLEIQQEKQEEKKQSQEDNKVQRIKPSTQALSKYVKNKKVMNQT